MFIPQILIKQAAALQPLLNRDGFPETSDNWIILLLLQCRPNSNPQFACIYALVLPAFPECRKPSDNHVNLLRTMQKRPIEVISIDRVHLLLNWQSQMPCEYEKESWNFKPEMRKSILIHLKWSLAWSPDFGIQHALWFVNPCSGSPFKRRISPPGKTVEKGR